MADTQSPQEGTSLAPSDVRALLAEISRISNDYDLRERIKEYDNALADSFIWRDCMEEADRLTTAARQPETCEWCRGPHGVQDCPRLGGSGQPKAMADQSTEARLREALTKQMDEQDEDLPSSIARQRGLVWLHGWFNLSALSLPVQDTSDELTRLRAEVEARDKALKPFAREADEYDFGDGSGPDLDGCPDASSISECNDLTIGDLRRARTTLNGEQANGG